MIMISQANALFMEAQQKVARMEMENDNLKCSLSGESDKNAKITLELDEQVSNYHQCRS